jgi:hypothetical protein
VADPEASVVVVANWKMLPVLRFQRIWTVALDGKWVML